MLSYKNHTKFKEFIMSKKFKQPADEIWAIIKETSEERKKTEQILKKVSEETAEFAKERKKTEQILKKVSEETAEFAKERKKTEKMMQEMSEEGEKTRKMIKETNKEFHKRFGNLGNDWGRMAENLVKGNLAKRLKDRGIEVEKMLTNIKNETSEFDIVAINGKEIVVVEVKSKLGEDDVSKFLDQIKNFKKSWPKMTKGKTIYGALAFVVSRNEQAFNKAKKEGFFVISATGDIIIENKKSFQPTAFLN